MPGMMGTRLKPVIEKGTDAVRRADTSLRLMIGLAVATLAVALITLVTVIFRGPVSGG